MGAPLVTLELRQSLAEYRRLLEDAFGPRLRSVRLFGSRARGDADVDSDADVSVIVDGLSDEERGVAIDLAMKAWRNAGGHGPLISPLPWSDAERAVRRDAERRIALDIDREGIPL
jgi:predicted nucleotidyltransferase